MLNIDPESLNGPGLFVFKCELNPVPRLTLEKVPPERLKTMSPPLSLKSQPLPPQPVVFILIVTWTPPVISVTVMVPRLPVKPRLLFVRLNIQVEVHVEAEAAGTMAMPTTNTTTRIKSFEPIRTIFPLLKPDRTPVTDYYWQYNCHFP